MLLQSLTVRATESPLWGVFLHVYIFNLHMFNIKSFVATALIGATAFVAPNADAAKYTCYDTVNNDRVCVYNVRGNRYEKSFQMDVNGRYAGTQYVYCNPAHRYTYVENANGIACFQFG